jgi:uncharacterized lipoprotein YmbA
VKHRKGAPLIATLSIALAAGCSFLSPRTDPTKFYVLTATAGADSTTSVRNSASHVAIGLGPVKLPDYLAHAEVVTRAAPNRLELSATDRWAEPLDESFRRVLARNLATLLGTDQVMPFPWDPSVALDYKIEVTVEHFERDASGGTQLAAGWIIRDGHDNRLLLSGKANFAESASGGMEGAATALSADLGDFSKQLADAIIELSRADRPRAAMQTD